jgi:hypothetical protein
LLLHPSLLHPLLPLLPEASLLLHPLLPLLPEASLLLHPLLPPLPDASLLLHPLLPLLHAALLHAALLHAAWPTARRWHAASAWRSATLQAARWSARCLHSRRQLHAAWAAAEASLLRYPSSWWAAAWHAAGPLTLLPSLESKRLHCRRLHPLLLPLLLPLLHLLLRHPLLLLLLWRWPSRAAAAAAAAAPERRSNL